MAAGQWHGGKHKLKFTFGNTHEEVPHPRKPGETSNRWVMSMLLHENVAQTANLIKSVTYHLHPTYPVNVIKVTQAPFTLTRLAWGWFDIEMEIEF